MTIVVIVTLILPQTTQPVRAFARIIALADEPRPVGCDKLAGAEGRFRVRQGQFRIVYAIDDASRTVEVVKVGHRREVHRGAA
ncbi:MAG: type II toxin-antitoxin system RelE/ParE family toxin [Betaproteobacteria bacterium]